MIDDLELGRRWAEIRRTTRLSRENFAQRAGLTPGALWRIEAKGRFKLGELERLRAAFPDEDARPVQLPGTPIEPDPSVRSSGPLEESPVDDLEVIWFDVIADGERRVQVREPSEVVIAEPAVLDVPGLSPWARSQLDGIVRITNSEIQAFKRCRRRWYLAHYMRYRPIGESPFGARAVGDRLHRALRWHYHGDPARRIDARDAIERVIAFDRNELISTYAEIDTEIPADVATRFAQESDLERIIIAGYVEWLAETGADSDLHVIGSEQYVEVDLPEVTNVRLVARLDARVRRISDGVRLFVDHKSVGDLVRPVLTLPLDEQMLFYQLVESLQQNEDERCAGAIYNMLRRVKRTANARPPFYGRVEVYHNAIEMAHFLTRTQGVIREMLATRAALESGIDHRTVAYPTPTQDCSWQCSFVNVDPMIDDGSRWEAAMAQFFTVGDPTAYYTKAT